jgi:hypothetical protein
MRRGNTYNLEGEIAIPNTTTSSNGTTAQSTATDTQGANRITFCIQVSGVGGGDTFTPLINESDDSGMSGENAVADADLDITEANATVSADGVKFISYLGAKRYITCDIVRAGGGVGNFSVVALKEPVIKRA